MRSDTRIIDVTALPEEVAHACLLCKEVGRPASREHFFPGGLGVHADLLLPRGAVCERCNNWTGRKVDEPLTKLPDILFMRGLLGIPDSKGRTVERLNHSSGTIMFGPEGFHVEVNSVIPVENPTPEQTEAFNANDETFRQREDGTLALTIAFEIATTRTKFATPPAPS